MGFLIVVSAMPYYWTWAYWANLFHYIIQGLITNELAGKSYTLLAPISESWRMLKARFFETGTDLLEGGDAAQSSAFMNLALEAGSGLNEASLGDTGLGALALLVQCMVDNQCLAAPIALNFISGNIVTLGKPPCKDEFEKATENAVPDVISRCFAIDDRNRTTVSDGPGSMAMGVPESFTQQTANATADAETLDLVLCLMQALLPPKEVDGITALVDIFKTVFDIGVVVIDVLVDGIKIPGEVILFVFGWADFENGSLEAPYKSWYCMFAVAMFLAGLEILKLLAVRFVVWTKR